VSAAVERIVNLALFLAAAIEPVTAEQIRAEVFGYPPDQDGAAFFRMFERDKKDLTRMGFAIESDTEGNYRLNARESFATAIELTPAEAATVRIASAALLGDPSFPFAGDLRLALAKVTAEVGTRGSAPAAACLADEEPQAQGDAVAVLSAAATAGKRVRFGYTNSMGVSAPHEIEPYGLFLHDGRWYAVGRDVALDEVRTYTVARISELAAEGARPETPDFERPQDFDISLYARLPFQFGKGESFEALLRFDPQIAWRARSLAAGQGRLEPAADGSVMWRVQAVSSARLLRFAIDNGPGIEVFGPASVVEQLASGLAQVVATHG